MFKHSFKQAVIHSGTKFIGMISSHFTKVATQMRSKFGFECDTSRCRGKQTCDTYDVTGLDFTLTMGPDFNVTVTGEDLLIPLSNDEEFQCGLALVNNGHTYLLGN
jgi:hypothetical protein